MEYNTLQHHGIKGQKWGVRRYRNEDGTLTSAGKKRAKTLSDSKRVKAIRKKKIKNMSNDELREANNRLQLERQYKDLTKKKSKGEKAVKAFITTAGTLVAVEGAMITYKRIGKKIVDKLIDG